jgi:hypothetical protein
MRLALRVKVPRDAKTRLYQAVDSEWRSSEELAAIVGIPFKSAVRYMMSAGYEDEDIESREREWVDERGRERRVSIYRRRSLSAREQAELYNSILFRPRTAA